MSEWISVDGHKNLPIGEWIVWMPNARRKMQIATVNGQVTVIGGIFGFDAKPVTMYMKPPKEPSNEQ